MYSLRRMGGLKHSTLACCLLALATANTRCSKAQTFSTYAQFQSLSVADMDSLRVKLTYGGPQDALVGTIVFAAEGTPIQMTAFVPYRRSGFEYSNDDLPIATAQATRQELRAIIDSVGTVPDITDGDADVPGRLSFVLLSSAGGTTTAFEAIVNQSSGRQLFRKLHAALRGNAETVRLLRKMGCAAAMTPPELPTAAGNLVKVTFDGLRPDRSNKGSFVGKVRVKNNSAGLLPAPVCLVIGRVGGNANLLEAEGTTCLLAPPGAFFIDLPVGAGLPAGATVEKTLHLSNPSLTKFTLHFEVFYGPGSR